MNLGALSEETFSILCHWCWMAHACSGAKIRMSPWQNKVALVTGGSSGLGRVIAEAFAAAGAKVAIVGLEADAVRQAADEMRSAGRDVLGIHADITRQQDVDRLMAETLDRFGRLDVLVNNAGRSMRGKVLDTTPEQFRELMELNLIALVRCTRAAVPHLLPAARPRGEHRLAGGEVGRPMGGGLSGHEVRRGRLQPAVAAGTGAARAARAPGLPRPDRAQRRPALSAGRFGRRARVGPKAGRRRAGAGHRAATACPGHSAGLPAPPAGIGRPRQGPALVRHFSTLAEPGRLDRAAEEWVEERGNGKAPADCGRREAAGESAIADEAACGSA